MKITGLKTFICNAFRTNFVFVKVETDQGIHGWGEATLEYRELTVQAEKTRTISRRSGMTVTATHTGGEDLCS